MFVVFNRKSFFFTLLRIIESKERAQKRKMREQFLDWIEEEKRMHDQKMGQISELKAFWIDIRTVIDMSVVYQYFRDITPCSRVMPMGKKKTT